MEIPPGPTLMRFNQFHCSLRQPKVFGMSISISISISISRSKCNLLSTTTRAVHVRRSRWTKLSSYIFPKLIFFEFNISNNFNGIEISPLLNCFNLISRLTILVANFDIKSIQHLQDLINIFHIYSLTTNTSLRFPFKFLKKTLMNPRIET